MGPLPKHPSDRMRKRFSLKHAKGSSKFLVWVDQLRSGSYRLVVQLSILSGFHVLDRLGNETVLGGNGTGPRPG